MNNDKELYEALGAIADALVPVYRGEFAILVRKLAHGSYGDADRYHEIVTIVRRWLRDAGYE